jgi:hypothetical protein
MVGRREGYPITYIINAARHAHREKVCSLDEPELDAGNCTTMPIGAQDLLAEMGLSCQSRHSVYYSLPLDSQLSDLSFSNLL